MSTVKTSTAIACLLLLNFPSAQGRTRKGDALIAKARRIEANDQTADLDRAFDFAQQALKTDPLDIGYQLTVNRLRAFAAQYHVYDGQVARDKGDLKTAMAEFQKAAALDPSSIVAPQEAERTQQVMHELQSQPSANIADLLLRPLSRQSKAQDEKFATSLPVPQLQFKLSKSLPLIKVNGDSSTEVFQAICKETGIRVLFDPDYQARGLGANQELDFRGLGPSQAFDYLALVTKSFWKPLSNDTIFVSNDDPQRRGIYEDQVTKAFYLTNSPTVQEANDVASTVQKITDIRKLFVHPEQNVIVARSDPDRIALAEKIVSDLDKPKAEIIIDVIILSVSKNWIRNLGVNLGLDGTTASFNPRASLGGTNVPVTNGFSTSTPTPPFAIPLDKLKNLTTGDFNVTLPGATLSALLDISGTKLLDKAQLRTIEGQHSTLNIGEKYPYATSSFIPGSAGTSSPLVNTQFQFLDIGLNIAIDAKVHEPDEVSLHIESDTSSVDSTLNLGGVMQPVVTQRKRIADVRVKEGEINFWDIVTERSETRDKSGTPFLSDLPFLGRFFSTEKLSQGEEQILTLLVPHIIRAPDIQDVNLMAIPSGSDQTVRMRYRPEAGDGGPPPDKDAELELPKGQFGPGVQSPGMPNAATGAPAVTNQPTPTGVPGGAPPGTGPRIAFAMPKVQAHTGTPFTADLMLSDGANDLGESMAVVQYDPKVIKLNSITPGALLSANGAAAPPGQKLEDGLVILKFGKPGMPAGAIATFNFVPAAAGTTIVQVPGARLINSHGQDIPSRFEPMEVTVQ